MGEASGPGLSYCSIPGSQDDAVVSLKVYSLITPSKMCFTCNYCTDILRQTDVKSCNWFY